MKFKPVRGYDFLHKKLVRDYIFTNLINSIFGVMVIYFAGYFYVKMKNVQVSSLPLYIILSPVIFLFLAVLTIGQFEFREKLKASKKVILEIDEKFLSFQDEKKRIRLSWNQITALTKAHFLQSKNDYYVFYRGGKIKFDDTFISEEDLKKFEVVVNREKVFLKDSNNNIFKFGDKGLKITRPVDLIEKYSGMKFI